MSSSKKTTLQVLMEARALIEKPENWCKYDSAIDEDGVPCGPSYYAAAKWCVMGAVRKFSESEDQIIIAARIFSNVVGYSPVGDWNDAPERTHAEVLAAFDKAIEEERSHAAA